MRTKFTTISFLLLGGAAMPALAQSEAGQNDGQLEEIVVTAQKRTENLIDVPISITTLSAEQLEQSARTNIRDLQYAVPNLTTYSQNDFSPNIIIRGFESSARNVGFESSLGVYVDGVFTGRTQSFTQELDDVERLEVLRGPQGTLFGKNTTTGAISLTTRRPSDEFEGRAKIEGGNFGYYRGGLSLSGPIVADKVAAKISGFVTGRDGYVKNVSGIGDADPNDEKAYGARSEIRFTPTETLDIAIRGDYSNRKANVFQNEISATLTNPAGLPLNNVIPGARTISTDPGNESRDLYGGSLTANYTLGNDGVITSISAARALRYNADGDADSSALPILAVALRERLSQYSQEIRYASPDTGRFKYVVGAYYFSQTAKAARPFILGDVSIAGLAAILEGNGVPPEAIPSLLTPNAISTDANIKTTSFAGFANGSFDITDKLSINAGIRYSSETKKLIISQTVPPVLDIGIFDAFINLPTTKDRIKDTDFSPTIGLSYKFSDDLNTYIRYSKGFKSGGWNAELIPTSAARFNAAGDIIGYSLDDIRFGPESIENYEIGLKSVLFDRKVRLNLAVFQQDYSDIQISQFVGGIQGFSTTNAAKARSRGFEIELSARPVAALDVNVGVGYADSKYRRYLTSNNGVAVDLSNARLDVPEWTLALGGQYSVPLSDGLSVVIGGDYSYRSARPGDPFDPLSKVNGFGLLDARIGLEAGDNWSIYLWGKNVFANDYFISRSTDTSNALLGLTQQSESYGDPRTFGVRASLNF